MTNFKIHRTYDHRYQFTFSFATRLEPVILYGNLHDNPGECSNEISALAKYIHFTQNISVACNNFGFRFTINAGDGKTIACSRFFPTRKLMQKILSITRNHITRMSMVIGRGISGIAPTS